MTTTPEEIPPPEVVRSHSVSLYVFSLDIPQKTTVSSSYNDVVMGNAVAVAEEQKVEESVNKKRGEDLSHLQVRDIRVNAYNFYMN